MHNGKYQCLGAGIAQWLEHRTRDWKVAGLNPCWNGRRIFFSRVDFLCWLLFRYQFHPRVTTVARKKSRSFCQKCRWQVTAKTRIHLTYVDFIEPCFGIGHNLSLICQMTSEDIKHQLIIIIIPVPYGSKLHIPPTNYHVSPSCSTRAIRKSLTHNDFLGGGGIIFWKKSQENGELWTISRKITKQSKCHWRELPQAAFLSRQTHVLVMTNVLSWQKWGWLLSRQNFLDKIRTRMCCVTCSDEKDSQSGLLFDKVRIALGRIRYAGESECNG